MSSLKVRGALVLGVIAISLAAPLFRLSLPTHPLIASAVRLSIAGFIWLPFAVYSVSRSTHAEPISSRLWIAGGGASVCYAIHFGAWVWSLGLTSVVASVTLVTTTPLMLGALGWWIGRDVPSPRLWGGIGLALIGVGILAVDGVYHASSDHGGSLIGDLLALLGAAGMAGYLWISRSSQEVMRLAPFSAMATLGAALILWSVAFFTLEGDLIALPSGEALWALIGAALIPQLVGHTLLTWSLTYISPTEVGLSTVAEPVGASLLAWVILNEVPSMWGAIGGGVVLCSLLWVMSSPAQSSSS